MLTKLSRLLKAACLLNDKIDFIVPYKKKPISLSLCHVFSEKIVEREKSLFYFDWTQTYLIVTNKKSIWFNAPLVRVHFYNKHARLACGFVYCSTMLFCCRAFLFYFSL